MHNQSAVRLPDAVSKLVPDIRLFGSIDDAMAEKFFQQLSAAREKDGAVLFELMTTGGDAETARRIALELRLGRDHHHMEIYFVGKTTVYSGGLTIMAAFPPAYRYLTRDTVLLVHERRLDRQVHFSGPLRANLQVARELLAEFENGQALERQTFVELALGTKVDAETLCRRATAGWYIRAEEALELGLVAGLI